MNTRLAFEYAYDVDAEIINRVDGILNPGSGSIKAREIAELIVEPDNCDINKTNITIKDALSGEEKSFHLVS